MLRIEKKENIMAKYLDQTGVQHLAEALVQNTKTVGGQSIWGSGNIEAGGGTSTITIASKSDLDTYKSALEDTSIKTVIFATTTLDLEGEDLTIRNAIFNTSSPCKINNGGTVLFSGCKTGPSNNSEGGGLPGITLFVASNSYIMASCDFLIRFGALNGNTIPIDTTFCIITGSRIQMFPIGNVDSLRVNGEFSITASYCSGLYFSSTSSISFYKGDVTTALGIYNIHSEMNCCDFSTISSFNNGSDVVSVKFTGCRFGDITIGNVFNVTQSIYATSLAKLYAGPTTKWPASEYGFNQPWSDF